MRIRVSTLGMIALGAVLGTAARHAVDIVLRDDGGMPWGTLTVNVSGCFLIGGLMAIVEFTAPHRLLRPFIGIGLLGGYTTFSAYAVETQVLLGAGRPELALAYLAATPVLAVLCCWAGAVLARTVIAYRGGRR